MKIAIASGPTHHEEYGKIYDTKLLINTKEIFLT